MALTTTTGASSLSASRNADPESHELLARALRPFILRRTKEQVAKDLPPRTEQTLWCELEPKQRKLYDELRDHYRASLLGLIDKQGVNKSKIQILEALLRLRQAACHPGLVDKSHAAAGPSADRAVVDGAIMLARTVVQLAQSPGARDRVLAARERRARP